MCVGGADINTRVPLGPFSASSRIINPKYSGGWNWTSPACNPFSLTWDHPEVPSVTTNHSPHFWTHWAVKNCLQLWGIVTNNKGSLHNVLLLRDFKRKCYHYFFSDGSDVSYLDEEGPLYCFKVLSCSGRPRACTYSGSTNYIMKRSVFVIFRFFCFFAVSSPTQGKLDYSHCSITF